MTAAWKFSQSEAEPAAAATTHARRAAVLRILSLCASFFWLAASGSAQAGSQRVYITRDTDGTVIIADSPPASGGTIFSVSGNGPALPPQAAFSPPAGSAASGEQAAPEGKQPQEGEQTAARVEEQTADRADAEASIQAEMKRLRRLSHRAAATGDTGKRVRLRKRLETLETELGKLRASGQTEME